MSATLERIFGEPKRPPLLVEADETYRLNSRIYLGSHALNTFRECPLKYHREVSGLVKRSSESESLITGRAMHALLCEGQDAFDQFFIVGGPVNPKTNNHYGRDTKAFEQWLAEQQANGETRTYLTDKQHEEILGMVEGIKRHEQAREIFSNPDAQAEGVARGLYCGRQCQVRIDWFDGFVTDLKTCDDLGQFERYQARAFGYLHQVSFYSEVLHITHGRLYRPRIVAVEKKEPFRCCVWTVTDAVFEAACRDNEAAIRELIECEKTGHWPTRYEGVRSFDYL
jgi:hypothetical protein